MTDPIIIDGERYWTPGGLAKHLNKTRATIDKWRRGVQSPSGETAKLGSYKLAGKEVWIKESDLVAFIEKMKE